MGNETGRSTPLRSSLMPKPRSTKRGAVTRRRRSAVDRLTWKKSLICFIPCSVYTRLSRGLYPSTLISLLILLFCFFFVVFWYLRCLVAGGDEWAAVSKSDAKLILFFHSERINLRKFLQSVRKITFHPYKITVVMAFSRSIWHLAVFCPGVMPMWRADGRDVAPQGEKDWGARVEMLIFECFTL